MGIKFIDDELVIGGGDWELAPFKFSKILKIGGGGDAPTPSWVDIIVTGTGSVTLANAKADGLNYVKLFGGCKQPQPDKPNLLTDLHKYSQYGVSVTIGDDNSIILNGKANSTSTISIKYSLTTRKLPAGTYTLAVYDKPTGDWTGTRICVPTSAKYVDFGSGSDTSITFTYTSDQSFYCYVRVVDGTVYDNFTIKAMLVEGSTAPLTYTPALPCMANPVAIKCNNGMLKYGYTTKNLNVGTLDNQGYTSTGGTSTSTTFCGTLWKIKVSEGEKYTVSCGNFPDGISGVFVNTWKTDGTFNLRQAISMSTYYTFTIPAGISEVNFTLYKTGGITIGSNSWMQVEKGETATAYVPAGYGLLIDGTTETVQVIGKNLFDINSCIANTYINSEGATNASASWICSGFIPVLPNTGYVFTVDTTSGASAKHCFYSQAQTESFISSINSGSQTFTTPPNARYMRISVRKESEQAQLELGSTATTYEPYYNGGSATAENLLGLDTAKDVQEVLTGAITRNIGVYIFDGTETYLYSSNYGGAVVVKDFINTYGVNTNKLPMCNYFIGKDQGNSTSARNGKSSCFWIPAYNYIGFSTDLASSTATTEFAQWVKGLYEAGTPLMVAYAKTTATTESVTPQALTTKAGTNIIEITQSSVNNLPLEVSYKGIQEQGE